MCPNPIRWWDYPWTSLNPIKIAHNSKASRWFQSIKLELPKASKIDFNRCRLKYTDTSSKPLVLRDSCKDSKKNARDQGKMLMQKLNKFSL